MIMRRLRFGAVLVGVVLALTGFSRHSSHSHGHSHSSGGGCSSSKSHSSSTTHHYNSNDDNTYGSSSGSSSRTSSSTTRDPKATGTVVTCAKKGAAAATVRVSARAASGSNTYRVSMSFLGAGGSVVDTGSATVPVYGNSSATVKVPMSVPSDAGSVTRCRIDSVQYAY
ncbi:hypothetical protein [Streptomyces sp. NBC_01089]|uniref:hypothetical protein n=1 Tax=Streptomyces sp. NBC_01089 TaxID=2903747 RepID=UPI00386ADFE6|nr:hypothetical protein OG510_22255 [Streptomyces sp. NBC_01089]